MSILKFSLRVLAFLIVVVTSPWMVIGLTVACVFAIFYRLFLSVVDHYDGYGWDNDDLAMHFGMLVFYIVNPQIYICRVLVGTYKTPWLNSR